MDWAGELSIEAEYPSLYIPRNLVPGSRSAVLARTGQRALIVPECRPGRSGPYRAGPSSCQSVAQPRLTMSLWLLWLPFLLVQQEDTSSSWSTRTHVFLFNKRTFCSSSSTSRTHVSCSTKRHFFFFNKNTFLLAQQEHISSDVWGGNSYTISWPIWAWPIDKNTTNLCRNVCKTTKHSHTKAHTKRIQRH